MAGVAIIGIGMVPFGRHEGRTGVELGATAVRAALTDSGVDLRDVQVGFGGTRSAGNNADPVLNRIGMTGIPFTNVANGCATGGATLISAMRAIAVGDADVALALGFDQYGRGALAALPDAWGLPEWYGSSGLMLTTQFFALKIQRYLYDHNLDPRILAQVAAKAFHNGSINTRAWRRQPLTVEEIQKAPMLCDPLTRYMFCHPNSGAAAVLLCRGDIVGRFTQSPVWLRSVALRTRQFGSHDVLSPYAGAVGVPTPSEAAAVAAFEQAGIGPDEVQVAQVQDTESGAEVMHLAETGFCAHGEQQKLIDSGATSITGSIPINTDGGCLANGEPVAASGLRQIYEVVAQLRGQAGAHQVPGEPRVGFTHVYGAPGVSACAVLSR